MSGDDSEFVFAPLGGLGEIGMNAALYGFGPTRARKWLMVDCGLAFPGPDLPGIDLIMPDISFVEKIGRDLVGLIITHAHEDHIGAVASLWPRLRCKVFATRFSAGLFEMRRLGEPGAPNVTIVPVRAGETIDLSPFQVEFIAVAHSIPESCALAIRTPAGLAVHTGDWKIDPAPRVGSCTDAERFRALGDEGVTALICDSTNILREGESFSESDVAKTLRQLVADAQGRVLVTTFSSNIARIRAVAEAAQACGRTVVVAGRAMDRAIQVARECGYLDGLPGFHALDLFPTLPRDKVVVIATGSQGEPRAALARVAEEEHRVIKLAPGDRVIFSSRTIPGNERSVNRVINGLCDQGVEIVTDRDHLVHCSGHPRRGEVTLLYDWVRPRSAVPAHGESHHLSEHAAFAKARGVAHVVGARNGDLVRLAPGAPGVIGKVPAGRLYKDGDALISADDGAVRERLQLGFAGIVSIALAIDKHGELCGDPDVLLSGLPKRGRSGEDIGDVVDEAIFGAFDNLPRQKRRDPDATATAVERAVRAAVNSVWGKKPQVHVLVVAV